MDFKVGDRVRIRSEKDLSCEYDNYDYSYFTDESVRLRMIENMLPYLGKEGVISSIISDNVFRLTVDNKCWRWSSSWLYPI